MELRCDPYTCESSTIPTLFKMISYGIRAERREMLSSRCQSRYFTIACYISEQQSILLYLGGVKSQYMRGETSQFLQLIKLFISVGDTLICYESLQVIRKIGARIKNALRIIYVVILTKHPLFPRDTAAAPRKAASQFQ